MYDCDVTLFVRFGYSMSDVFFFCYSWDFFLFPTDTTHHHQRQTKTKDVLAEKYNYLLSGGPPALAPHHQVNMLPPFPHPKHFQLLPPPPPPFPPHPPPPQNLNIIWESVVCSVHSLSLFVVCLTVVEISWHLQLFVSLHRLVLYLSCSPSGYYKTILRILIWFVLKSTWPITRSLSYSLPTLFQS
jgi:hypothetical protein